MELKPTRRYFHEIHKGDRFFRSLLRGLGLTVLATVVLLFVQLLQLSWPTFQKFGFRFFTSTNWDPVSDLFGGLPFLYGTLTTSAIAILIAAPVSIGVALFITELASPKLGAIASLLIEMLAAIPSIIYGLWGAFVLVPWMRTTVEPFLGHTLGWLPIFSGPPLGMGVLTAGIVLAVMITPTITAICREVFSTVSTQLREGALALGATRWEMILLSVLKTTLGGVMGAVTLGLGRALGETMAVTMVIGNRNEINVSLLAPGQTMASVIANEYAEATSDLHLSSLAAIGLYLLLVSLLIHALSRVLVKRYAYKKQSTKGSIRQ